MTLQDDLQGTKEIVVAKVGDALENASKIEIPQPAKSSGILDTIQEKVISRKLLVFGVSTVLMWYGLDSETWGMIAMTYIGGQTAIDFAKVWRGA
jgi:hypothetical protein